MTHYLSHALVNTVNTHGHALWSHQACKTLTPWGNPLSAPCASPPRQLKADGNNRTTGQTDQCPHPLIPVSPHRRSILTSLCAYRVSLVKIHSLQRLFQNPLFSNLQLPHPSPRTALVTLSLMSQEASLSVPHQWIYKLLHLQPTSSFLLFQWKLQSLTPLMIPPPTLCLSQSLTLLDFPLALKYAQVHHLKSFWLLVVTESLGQNNISADNNDEMVNR